MSTDYEIAQQMFLNMPYAMRVRDVRTTERFATDIQHYRPRENDWPGLDEEGASAMRRPWESLQGAVMNEPAPTKKARDRRVVGYVNWYGDNIESVLYPEPIKTWSVDSRMTQRNYRVLDLLPDSLLYRSEPEDVQMNSPATKRWFTSRAQAIVYNDIHYNNNDRRMKAVYPFIVTKPTPLLDMNDAVNVAKVRTDILRNAEAVKNTEKEDAFRNLERTVVRAFRVDDVTGAVGRRSTVDDDNLFCTYFDKAYPQLAGWIYMRSEELRQHHDEIYINKPDEYLVRAPFVVKEIREQAIAYVGSSNDDDNDIQVNLDEEQLEDSVDENDMRNNF